MLEMLLEFSLNCSNVWFEWIAQVWWRQLLVLTLGLGLLWRLRAHEPQLRRIITIVCAALLLVPPLLTIESAPAGIAPLAGLESTVLQPEGELPSNIIQGEQTGAGAHSALGFTFLLFGLWSLGALLVLARLIHTSLPIWRLTLQAQKLSDAQVPPMAQPFNIYAHPQVEIPFVTAWLGGTRVVLPAAWIESQTELNAGQEAVLAHEIAHIKQHDQFLVWLFAALKVVLWWNPLVWKLGRCFLESAELSCDDAARARTKLSSVEFAQTLLSLVPQRKPLSAVAVSFSRRPSLVKQRITHQFKPQHKTRMRKTLMLGFGVVALPLVLLMSGSNASSWGFTINLQAREASLTDGLQPQDSETSVSAINASNVSESLPARLYPATSEDLLFEMRMQAAQAEAEILASKTCIDASQSETILQQDQPATNEKVQADKSSLAVFNVEGQPFKVAQKKK